MFEQLFRYPGVIEHYHAGPHAEDRLRYLVHLAGTGARTQTLQLAASRQLALVQLLDVRDDQRVLREQLDAAIERWAQPRPRRRGPASPAAVAAFRGTVTHWLHFVGRLAIAESPPRPFASCVAEFADWMRLGEAALGRRQPHHPRRGGRQRSAFQTQRPVARTDTGAAGVALVVGAYERQRSQDTQ